MTTCAIDTSDKFASSVSDTGGQFATGVIDTDGAPLVANIFKNFPPKIGMALLELLGPGERYFIKKSLDTVPVMGHHHERDINHFLAVIWSGVAADS